MKYDKICLMKNKIKELGKVYTPKHIVCLMLDHVNYKDNKILKKHIIDNSCGDGAFLIEVVERYCREHIKEHGSNLKLKNELETFIHGIELDSLEKNKTILNLDKIANEFKLKNVKWDILNENTLNVNKFDETMDFVVGNPPYVRVHNLKEQYNSVKNFSFVSKGMTDLFLVFFEIGIKMLNSKGSLIYITPSSYLHSLAGKELRIFLNNNKIIKSIIDLGHYQPFEATTYTAITEICKMQSKSIKYYELAQEKKLTFIDELSYKDIYIDEKFYFDSRIKLNELRKIVDYNLIHNSTNINVKNGLATLSDKVFIGEFKFTEGTIDVYKASTGKWSKLIFPYDESGKPLSLDSIAKKYKAVYEYLNQNKEKLTDRDLENAELWYLFGRSQAIKDIFRDKLAFNTLIKDLSSIKIELVEKGKAVYSGLYFYSHENYDIISKIIKSENFLDYIKSLKNYKSGGYYTFSSQDLKFYLNYKLNSLF